MMTAEFMLSKRSVLRFTAALFFLLKSFKLVSQKDFVLYKCIKLRAEMDWYNTIHCCVAYLLLFV